MDINFNEENHQYQVGSVIVPSVTQILNDMGLTNFCGASESIMKRAQDFGKAVHKATELFDKNDLDFSALSTDIVPYLEAWKKFKEDYEVEIKEIEFKGYNPLYKYAGTLDRIAIVNGAVSVIDIKTSAVMSPATALQTAAYALFCDAGDSDANRYTITMRYGAQLKSNGNYNLEIYDKPTDKSIFLSAASLWWWRKNHGLI